MTLHAGGRLNRVLACWPHRCRFLENQRREEQDAVTGDTRVSFWMNLIMTDRTPPEMAWRVPPVAVRALVKALPSNTSLVALDLCNCELKDDVGEALGRMLATNTTLRRLDLDNNSLGPKSLSAIADGLARNPRSALISLSLERNPLTGEPAGKDFSGLRAFCLKVLSHATRQPLADAASGSGLRGAFGGAGDFSGAEEEKDADVSVSRPGSSSALAGAAAGDVAAAAFGGAGRGTGGRFRGLAAAAAAAAADGSGGSGAPIDDGTVGRPLVSVNLFQCGLRREGGKLLVHCLRTNTALTHLQLAPTDDIEAGDLSLIVDILRDNARAAADAAAAAKAARAAARRAAAEAARKADAEAAAAAEVAWIEGQRQAREDARRKAIEDEMVREAKARAAANAEEAEKIARWKAEEKAAAEKAAAKAKGGKKK